MSYESLLHDFSESVHFILDNRSPAQNHDEQERKRLEKECKHILSEVGRLEMGRKNFTLRLQNAMGMVRV
jgi:hypothetical protein